MEFQAECTHNFFDIHLALKNIGVYFGVQESVDCLAAWRVIERMTKDCRLRKETAL